VRYAVLLVSGESPFLLAMAYARNASSAVRVAGTLRRISVRMKDWTAGISYFWEAASRDKTLSYATGISEGIGYITVRRARTISASSDMGNTGSSLAISVGGCGSENMVLKNWDEKASMDLWTRKLTRSED
jgi:hypothetical protein